ncbi:hypothetical protein I7I53_06224 [Histoplasma capsulatum var. duboisii H88]|uniref:Uncharacterized protein n=1 Tax=Ajellomyces capsulatus (strain H88) TaxID=544711 RepID=A0A8A1LBL4_AJEC8|nr:hypothetical protein I7I53_06224 [Histoplasma capsulatum var. duboisii H88]
MGHSLCEQECHVPLEASRRIVCIDSMGFPQLKSCAACLLESYGEAFVAFANILKILILKAAVSVRETGRLDCCVETLCHDGEL